MPAPHAPQGLPAVSHLEPLGGACRHRASGLLPRQAGSAPRPRPQAGTLAPEEGRQVAVGLGQPTLGEPAQGRLLSQAPAYSLEPHGPLPGVGAPSVPVYRPLHPSFAVSSAALLLLLPSTLALLPRPCTHAPLLPRPAGYRPHSAEPAETLRPGDAPAYGCIYNTALTAHFSAGGRCCRLCVLVGMSSCVLIRKELTQLLETFVLRSRTLRADEHGCWAG